MLVWLGRKAKRSHYRQKLEAIKWWTTAPHLGAGSARVSLLCAAGVMRTGSITVDLL